MAVIKELGRELNKQEEDYVAFLIAGQTQRVAYRHAFKQSKKWKDKTVDNRAYQLFNSREVQARYKELLKQAKDAASNMATWSRAQSFSEHEWLKNKAKEDIIENGVRQANSNAFLGALAKMDELAINGNKSDLEEELLRAKVEELQAKLKAEQEDDEDEFDGFEFVRRGLDNE
ncbi:terminase small subunit [Streptococcus hyovaginalis]